MHEKLASSGRETAPNQCIDSSFKLCLKLVGRLFRATIPLASLNLNKMFLSYQLIICGFRSLKHYTHNTDCEIIQMILKTVVVHSLIRKSIGIHLRYILSSYPRNPASNLGTAILVRLSQFLFDFCLQKVTFLLNFSFTPSVVFIDLLLPGKLQFTLEAKESEICFLFCCTPHISS